MLFMTELLTPQSKEHSRQINTTSQKSRIQSMEGRMNRTSRNSRHRYIHAEDSVSSLEQSSFSPTSISSKRMDSSQQLDELTHDLESLVKEMPFDTNSPRAHYLSGNDFYYLRCWHHSHALGT
jgi:hypothetical protein